MEEVTTVGLDIAEHVLQARGADGAGRAVFSRTLGWAKLLAFFGRQPRCLVALEASAKWGQYIFFVPRDSSKPGAAPGKIYTVPI